MGGMVGRAEGEERSGRDDHAAWGAPRPNSLTHCFAKNSKYESEDPICSTDRRETHRIKNEKENESWISRE
jgi:hypothetical protein